MSTVLIGISCGFFFGLIQSDQFLNKYCCKTNAAANVGADLCVCPGSGVFTLTGADTQVCPHAKHRKIVARMLKHMVQTQQSPEITSMRTVERNLLAPELYADSLSLQISLIDLPGAKEKDSSWEVSYQLYFISEANYLRFFQKARRQASGTYSGNPTPADFAGKLLLNEGSFKKTSLVSLQDRQYERTDIPFKEKIPAEQRTKFARLLLSYSVKVFDARLKIPLYRSSLFFSYPYLEDAGEKRHARPRREVQAHFHVTPTGRAIAL
jgi:hypothetical protein